MPNVGPWLGCLTHANVFFFKCAPSACASPIVVVDFPSPSGVGVIPPTTTYFPLLLFSNRFKTFSETFAFVDPYWISSDSVIPHSDPRTLIGFGFWAEAISISD